MWTSRYTGLQGVPLVVHGYPPSATIHATAQAQHLSAVQQQVVGPVEGCGADGMPIIRDQLRPTKSVGYPAREVSLGSPLAGGAGNPKPVDLRP